MKFIDHLYIEAQNIFDKYKDKNVPGLVIFYGPVCKSPELMIIGDNPGGNEEAIQKEPEPSHDYKVHDYKMANRMKMIFSERHEQLFKSIKFNRIFFKSKDKKTFKKNPNWQTLEQFGHLKTIEIIKELKPAKIITEGFEAFRALNDSTSEVVLLKGANKNLILKGQHGNIELIGLTHPSSTWGLSSNDISQMNTVVKSLL